MKKIFKYLVNTSLSILGFQIIRKQEKQSKFPIDYPSYAPNIIDFVRPYTMCGNDGLMMAIEAARYIVTNRIQGDIVECGVWRGGCSMAMALAIADLKSFDRNLWLYDTYDGMTPPTNEDVDKFNQPASLRLDREKKNISTYTEALNVWCVANLDDVKNNILSISYPNNKFKFIKGDVAKTLLEFAPEKISILRLDTDWYASTKIELEVLYPKLVSGGILIIDDYGDWQGARKAVDEYFNNIKNPPLLVRVDGSRFAIKP